MHFEFFSKFLLLKFYGTLFSLYSLQMRYARTETTNFHAVTQQPFVVVFPFLNHEQLATQTDF